MRSFREISEAPGDAAVFTFGRFNPPTTGHEKLIDALAKESKKVSGSKMYVFASHSQDPKKNPLPYPKKIAYMKKMFPKYKSNITTAKQRNVFEVATSLYDKGHKSVVMVVGSDRVAEFDRLLNEYNDVKGRHGFYKFDDIKVVSAGERDPDAEGVEGMSASKMRAAAAKGEFDQFKQGLPSGFKDAKKLFRDVLAGMGIREERDMGEMTEYEELRDAYLTNKIWKIDDLVEANGIEGRVVRRGTNYISYMDGSGKVHKAWLHDIAINERNYRKEYDNYHSRPEQIEKRSSRNKARRAMGDKVVKGMDVGHKDNNPLNNDPDNLRNEDPSKNRREPRLREDTLDEMSWFKKAKAKIDQMSHPKGYEKMVKQFVSGMQDKEHKDHPSAWAAEIAREYRISARSLIQYINKLVQKGVLPKDLRAEVQTEMITFKDLVQQINEVKQDKDIKDREGTQPAKYYAKDTEGDAMAKSTKQARARHFAKKKKGPAPGDASATTKPSKHTQKFKQMYGEKLGKDADAGDYIDDFQKSDAPQFKGKSKEKRKDMAIAAYLDKKDKQNEAYQIDEKITALVNKAKKTGMPYSILKKVYDRGMAAYKTGHRPGATPQQWAMARVNSFTTKSSGTWGKADKDLAKQVRGEGFDDDVDESLWANIHKKRQRIKGGSGERMRKKGEKGAPTPAQMKRAKSEEAEFKNFLEMFSPVHPTLKKELGTHGDHAIGMASTDKGVSVSFNKPKNVNDLKKQMSRHGYNSVTKVSDTTGKHKHVYHFQESKEEAELNEWGEITEKAEYQGKSVELNNPTRGDIKKYKVYVKNEKGNVVKVEFGDPNMEIKRDDPGRRANFRARHNCDNPGPKYKARYWSCKFWSAKSVTDLMKG